MSTAMKARGFVKGSLDKNPHLGQWLAFDVPEQVTLRVGKVDIGQGISTALAQIAAEELDVDLSRIVNNDINTAQNPDEGVTSGSFSIEHSGAAVRMACATIRAMAVAQFCQAHQVDAATVKIVDGCFTSSAIDACATYWDLNLQAYLGEPVSDQAATKPVAHYTKVGFSEPRIDLAKKLFGQASFIQDMVLPGMLHARVVRTSNRAGHVLSVDEAGFKQRMPDVILVRDGSFLGVMAAREEVAIAAAELLETLVQWHLPAVLPDCGDLAGFLTRTPSERNSVSEKSGPAESTESAVASGSTQLSASYLRPFIAHASIGPSCAVAQWSEAKLEVWCHSQGIFNLKTDIEVFLRREYADASAPAVVVHHVDGAGCYGHNPADDVAFDAVLLARAASGCPVRVVWSRADELSCGPSGSAHLVRLQAELSPEGLIADWKHENWSNGYTSRPGRNAAGALSFKAASELAQPFAAPIALDPPMSAGGGGDRNAIPDYDFPQHSVVYHRLLEMPVRTSAIRALGGYANVWAIESFMDELALSVQRDPVAFRLQHLSDPRARAVIEKAIEQAPWWHDKSHDKEGTGRGLAFARYKNNGAWCAVAVQIRAEASIRVERISIAADVGLVINPDGVKSQLEGGAIQSCSWTLKEELRFSRETMLTRSWEDYPILNFSEAPVVEVAVIDRPSEPSLGAGEATQGPTAAAIGNAVFDALGVRIRQLPLTPERILSALAA
jgi:CO/xanthine dehydrogenase Mo-binding subunit